MSQCKGTVTSWNVVYDSVPEKQDRFGLQCKRKSLIVLPLETKTAVTLNIEKYLKRQFRTYHSPPRKVTHLTKIEFAFYSSYRYVLGVLSNIKEIHKCNYMGNHFIIYLSICDK